MSFKYKKKLIKYLCLWHIHTHICGERQATKNKLVVGEKSLLCVFIVDEKVKDHTMMM